MIARAVSLIFSGPQTNVYVTPVAGRRKFQKTQTTIRSWLAFGATNSRAFKNKEGGEGACIDLIAAP
jgi:hypothetical protein